MNRSRKVIPEKNDNKSLLVMNNLLKTNSPTNYGLNTSFFDPSENSPPNDFMLKLSKRIECYISLGINDNKFVNE
jgi:hypothetical protein